MGQGRSRGWVKTGGQSRGWDLGVQSSRCKQKHTNIRLVLGTHDSFIYLVDGLPLEDGLHGAEDLICGDDVVVLHVAEDSGLNVVPLVSKALAPTLQFGSLLLSLLDHAQDLVKLLLGHLHATKQNLYASLDQAHEPTLWVVSSLELP